MDYSEYVNLPAASPPPDVVPNFDDPPSRALEMYIGMGICAAVSAFFLALRMYAKFIVTHSIGWDDLACSIGFALVVAQMGVTFSTTGSHGVLGTHQWDFRIGQVAKAYDQKILATLDLYAAAAFSIKLSLFLLYLRLFKPDKLTRWLIYGGIITCGLFYSACIIGNCVLLMPTPGQPNDNSAWLLRSGETTHPLAVLPIVQSAFGTLSDIYMLVIPIQMIFQLHFPIERKIGVSAVFMVGILAVACSLASLVNRVKLLSTTDRTWSAVWVYIFYSAELGAGIVCSCMPICASLLRGHIPKDLHHLSPRQFYLNLRSRRSRRPPVSNQTHLLNNLQPHKRDSKLVTLPKDYARLEEGSGLEETKNSVMTPRERLEY